MTPTVAQISVLESGKRENTAHICNELSHLTAALLTAKEVGSSSVTTACLSLRSKRSGVMSDRLLFL